MHRPLSFWLRGLCHVLLVALAGYLIWSITRPDQAVAVTLDDQHFRVTGPYRHDNLAVYLIHADQQDELQYITLQEGLEKGLVKVTEKESSQVNELQIDNQSDQHLFLQEGDRLSGGKQDRTIYAGHVVPPKSGPQPLPAFCIEPSRWSGGGEFKNASNASLAPQEVRFAAKYLNSQSEVWANVARQRDAINANVQGALNFNTTSLNEALDAPQIKKLCDDFASALDGVVKQHPDALGVAIVINGRIEEVNVYPNHGLLAKQYPRLVQSYAVQAAIAQKEEQAAELTALDVARVMWQSRNADASASAQVHATLTAYQEEMMVQTGANPFDGQGGGVEMAQSDMPNFMSRMQQGRGQEVQRMQDNVRAARGTNLYGYRGIDAAAQPAARVQPINRDNRMELFQSGGIAGGKTEYQGKPVHWQFIRSGQAAQPARAQVNPGPRNNNDVQEQRQEQRQVQPQAPNQ